MEQREILASNVGRIKEILSKWDAGRGYFSLEEVTPWKTEDKMGMGFAMMMLKKSLEKGRLAEYVQYDTYCNMRSAASNLYIATAKGNEERSTLKSIKGSVLHLQDDPM